MAEDKSENALGRVRGAEAEAEAEVELEVAASSAAAAAAAATAAVAGEVVLERLAALMLPLRCCAFAALEAIASQRDDEPADAESAV